MNAQQKGLITLVKSALDGKNYTLPEGFDLQQAIQTALEHRIVALVYYGALNCGFSKKEEPLQRLFSYLIATMNITEKQHFELDKLYAALDAEKLEYMPMKGAILQQVYPKREMRTMGDADILIRMEQYDTVARVMQELGYVFQYESDHELVWKKNKVVIELHKHVIPTYEPDYYAYFGNGWKRAKQGTQILNRYEFSAEDFYLYLFVHFAKHYRMAGIGIKHLVDLQVYLNANPEMNMDHIRKGLESMDLVRFYDNIADTIAAWFGDGELTEKADYITQVLFDSGEYGLSENYEATRILRKAREEGSIAKVRRNDRWGVLFLNLKGMQLKYPVLNKAPFLLPVFWVVRWFEILLFKQGKIKRYVKQQKTSNEENVEKYKQALDFVGLDYLDKENDQ